MVYQPAPSRPTWLPDAVAGWYRCDVVCEEGGGNRIACFSGRETNAHAAAATLAVLIEMCECEVLDTELEEFVITNLVHKLEALLSASVPEDAKSIDQGTLVVLAAGCLGLPVEQAQTPPSRVDYQASRDVVKQCVADSLSSLSECASIEDATVIALKIMHLVIDWEELLEELGHSEDVIAADSDSVIAPPWRRGIAKVVADAFGCRLAMRNRFGGGRTANLLPSVTRFWFVGYETAAHCALATFSYLSWVCLRLGRMERCTEEVKDVSTAVAAATVSLELMCEVEDCLISVPHEVERVFPEFMDKLTSNKD